jgi:transcriptional regulator with XRE-family HTH domain
MTISKKLLSLKIKNLRKLNNLTQEHLSEMIDITPRHLVRIESGICYPSIETIWKISKVFKTDINSLLEDFQEESEDNILKSEINNLLTKANPEDLKLIKKLIFAVLSEG